METASIYCHQRAISSHPTEGGESLLSVSLWVHWKKNPISWQEHRTLYESCNHFSLEYQ